MNIQKKWTEDEKATCIRLRESGLSMSEIGEHLDRSKSSVSNFLWALNNEHISGVSSFPYSQLTPKEAAVKQYVDEQCSEKPAPYKSPTVTGTEEEIVAESCTENVRTLEDLIRVCNIDLEKWQIERWTANTWPVGIKVEDRVITKNLYQVKAILKLKPITQADIQELFASFSPYISTTKSEFIAEEGSKLLEISIPDLHLGKLCWGDETGGANYDTNIAMERFKTAMDDLLSKVDPNDVSEILFPIGNDALNVDSKNNETANGTPQTEDGRWQKSFKKACELSTWAINRCLEVAPVRVPIVPGNHDTERSYYLGCFLEAMFNGNSDVEVNNTPTERKYCRFGNTLICFTHGDRIKLKDLIALAQNEQRKAWGQTKFCEWHLGHLHRESVMEDGGVIARVIPSLCPPDAWHAKHGFVMAIPAAQAFVYDDKKGLETIHYHRVR